MAEGHSHIGASSAYRWMNCPGSVRLYNEVTRRAATIYAATGTVAHEICEKCLLEDTTPELYLGCTFEADGFSVTVDMDMARAVSVYVNKVRDDLAKFGGSLMVEQSFDLSWLHPGMFGRNDSCIVPTHTICGTLIINDYKNGRKQVDSTDNPQCQYYGLGALGERNVYAADKVICNIIQPNCYDRPDPIDSWETDTKSLYEWGYDVLRPAAKRTEDPDAPCKTGAWCHFCEAAGICPAKKNEVLALFKAERPAQVTLPSVRAISNEELGQLTEFFTSESFTKWVATLAAEEQARLSQGIIIPGRKLIEKQSLGNRKWSQAETEVLSTLLNAVSTLKREELFPSHFATPSEAEKILVGAGLTLKESKDLLATVTSRPATTKYIAVSESHPAPAFDRQLGFSPINEQ